jgi:hypothetical protein
MSDVRDVLNNSTVTAVPFEPRPATVLQDLILELEHARYLAEELSGALHAVQRDLVVVRDVIRELKARPSHYVTRREVLDAQDGVIRIEYRLARVRRDLKLIADRQVELLRRLTAPTAEVQA